MNSEGGCMSGVSARTESGNNGLMHASKGVQFWPDEPINADIVEFKHTPEVWKQIRLKCGRKEVRRWLKFCWPRTTTRSAICCGHRWNERLRSSCCSKRMRSFEPHRSGAFDVLLSTCTCRWPAMASPWSAPCDIHNQRDNAGAQRLPELDEALSAIRLQADEVL